MADRQRLTLTGDEQNAARTALRHARKNGLPQEHHDHLESAVADHSVHQLDPAHKDLLGHVFESHMDSDTPGPKHRKLMRGLMERHDLHPPEPPAPEAAMEPGATEDPIEKQRKEQARIDKGQSVGTR